MASVALSFARRSETFNMYMNTKTPEQNRLKQNEDYRRQKHLKTPCLKYRVLSLDII